MIRIFLSFMLLALLFNQAGAQDSSAITVLDPWIGHWEGPFELFKTSGRTDSLKVEIDIEKTGNSDSLRWNTRFTMGEKIIDKPYSLFARAEKGQYMIDEHNSIYIPSFLFDHELLSFYKVMNQYILVQNRLVNDSTMELIMTIANDKEPMSSGGGKINEESIPKVDSYSIKMVQKGMLHKRKE